MVKKGVSLVELVIIAAILGIMAAIVVPFFQSQSTQAKEAVAKDHLRILRSAIELYTVQHGGIPPGYKDDDVATTPAREYFYNQLVRDGRYLVKIPKNPFNNLETIQINNRA